MADGITIPPSGVGSATPVVATDDVAGSHYQKVKVDVGGDGASVALSTGAGAVGAGTPRVAVGTEALTAGAPAAATVGAASAEALAANSARRGLVMVNTSNNTISLGLGATAVLNSGITLLANGGTWVMDRDTFTTAAVNAIASAASSNLAIQELTT